MSIIGTRPPLISETNLYELHHSQMIKSYIPLNYDVFFSEAMHRQVAKIAYEWYCLKNKVEDKYDDFSEIIEYILEGNNNQVVKMVTDKLLLDFDIQLQPFEELEKAMKWWKSNKL